MKLNLYICFILSFSYLSAQISFSETSVSQNINVAHGSGAFVGGMSFFDFNNDGWDDLSYASQDGDPLYFFQNNSGVFAGINFDGVNNVSDTRQINWVDIDNDGDEDYLFGNLGLNSKFKASTKKPLHLFCDDFDKNGTLRITKITKN